jgi:hypothetical protein
VLAGCIILVVFGPGFLVRAEDSTRASITMRDPGPDLGGDFPNGGGVVPAGGLYLEWGVLGGYTIAFGYTRTFHRDAAAVPVLLRYGVVRKLELRLAGTLYSYYDKEPDMALQGTGPIQLGCKYSLIDPSRSRNHSALALEFEAVLPLASADLDPGRVEPNLQLDANQPLGSGFWFHWNAGVSTAVDADGDLFAQASLKWSVAKAIEEDWSVYLTGTFVDPDTEPGGIGEIVAGAGFLWFPTDRTSLQVTLAGGFRDVREVGVQVSGGFAF